MTWTRVKRWIATHPETSVAAAGAFILCVPGLVIGLLSKAIPNLDTLLGDHFWLCVFCLVLMVACIACASFYVVCLRQKAGLPVMKGLWFTAAWQSLLMTIGLFAVTVLVRFSLGARPAVNGFYLATILTAGMVASLYVALASGVGAWLARRFARRQIAKGKWEVTIPVESPKEHQ